MHDVTCIPPYGYRHLQCLLGEHDELGGDVSGVGGHEEGDGRP